MSGADLDDKVYKKSQSYNHSIHLMLFTLHYIGASDEGRYGGKTEL